MLGILTAAANVLVANYVATSNEAAEQAFRITKVASKGRALHLEGRSGPFGADGSLEQVDTGDSSPITTRHAAMRNVRASIFVPLQSDTAVLCLEMSGNSSLRRGLYQDVLQPLGRQFGFIPELSALQDAEAWAAFLDAGETRRVTRIYRPRTAGTLGPRRADDGELRQVLSGGLARRAGSRARRALGDRLGGRGQPDAIAINAEIDQDFGVTAAPARAFELQRTELDVKVGDTTRKVVVVNSDDGLPQFVYPFGTRNRPGWQTMRDLFTAQAVKLYNRTYGQALESSEFSGRASVQGAVPEVTLE